MGYAALFSGGKDSSYALYLAQEKGLSIDKLVTVIPEKVDSYMFHRPNLEMVPQLAASLDIDLVTVRSTGEKEEELKDLKDSLKRLKIEGVVSGAVASSYQKERIDDIADEIDLEVFSPLWGMDQYDLVQNIIYDGFKCIIVMVAAMGLDEGWLGREIDGDRLNELRDLNERYGINIAGEGGEYESFVISAPNYRWGFEVIEGERRWDGHRGTFEVNTMKKKI